MERKISDSLPAQESVEKGVILSFKTGKRLSEEEVQAIKKEEIPTAKFLREREMVIERAGPVGLSILQDFESGKINKEAFEQAIENAPDFSEFQELALRVLEQYGIVEQKGDKMIVDIDKLKDLVNDDISRADLVGKHTGQNTLRLQKRFGDDQNNIDGTKKILNDIRKKYFDFSQNDIRAFLFNAFYGKEVVSSSDWQRDEDKSVTKPLFYSPESSGTAFDVEKIKQSQFHVGLWEIKSKRRSNNYSPFHPNLPYDDTVLAAVIFHPQYGNGMRDKTGLMVNYRDQDTKQFSAKIRRLITGDWVSKDAVMYGTTFKSHGTGNTNSPTLAHTPRQYLEKGNLSELTKWNLLKPDDFGVLVESGGKENFGLYRKISKTRVGQVMLDDKIRYTLGSEFGNGQAMVFSISPEQYGIVTKDEKGNPKELVAILDRVYPGDPRLKLIPSKTGGLAGGGYFDMGRRELIKGGLLKPYVKGESEVFTKKKSDESQEEYEARVSSIIDFADLLETRHEVERESGVSLENLNPREQSALLGYYRGSSPKERKQLYNFIIRYREDGLKSFLALHSDGGVAEKIFDIDKNFKTAEAALIFRKYSELTEQMEGVDTELEKFFNKEKGAGVEKVRVTEEIEKKANSFLLKFATQSGEQIPLPNLIKELDKIRGDGIAFAAMCRAAFGGKNEGVNIEQIRGMSYESISGEDFLSPDREGDREKMKQLLKENNIEQGRISPFAEKVVLPGLVQAFGRPNQRFYVLRKDGDIIAYLRFEDKHDGTVYFGSFNVDNNTTGAGFGSVLMQNRFEQEAVEHSIVANVEIDNPVAQSYINKSGFVVTEILESVAKTGVHGFTIRRDDRVNKDYQRANAVVDGKDVLTKTYDIKKDTEFLSEVGGLVNSGEYVISYYKIDNPAGLRTCVLEKSRE